MAPILAVLVVLPMAALVATTLTTEPVALAEDAPAQAPPSDGPVAGSGSQPVPRPAPAAPRTTQSKQAAPAAEARKAPAAGRSPWAGRIPDRGSGRFRTADVSGRVAGERGRLLRYSVRVEKELPFDPDAVARQVQQTLSDRRSWTGSGWRLQLVPKGKRADFSVLVATPETTDRYCLPLFTWGRLSCQDGSRAVLNARRWAFGAKTYGDDVAAYRLYLVNHEVGHVLGFGHESCPKGGARAPVMVQQTKGLQGCRPNPWPSPRR